MRKPFQTLLNWCVVRVTTELTGKTLHDESDEPVELAHFRVNAFEHRHGYHISDRKMMTPTAAERQQNMMVHLNSDHLE